MSRLIIKQLPNNVTETKIKELFSQKGVVTDVQLKYTQDGKFRHFGFVGYKTEEEANVALEYFNGSYMNAQKIKVEKSSDLGDANKPKSWSKYAPDSSAYEKNAQKISSDSKKSTEKEKKSKKKKDKKIEESNQVKEALEKHINDPLFNEFLESHKVSNVEKILINNTIKKTKSENEDSSNDDEDDDDDAAADKSTKDEEDNKDNEDIKEEKLANKNISDLEYMQALKKKSQPDDSENVKPVKEKKDREIKKFFTVKIRGLGYNHKKKHIKDFFKPLKAKSIRVPQKIKGIAYVGFKTEKIMNQALIKNKSFLEGKRLLITKYDGEKEQDDKNIKNKDENCRWKAQIDGLKDVDEIGESGRMYIRNLSYTTTEDDVRALFEKYGTLVEVNLPIDKVTRKPKGFGTVTFMMPEHAVKAFTELDGSTLNGRLLHILPGKAPPSLTDQLEKEGLSFKEKKDLKQKATAHSSHNWNTLFLGQNAVVEAIASTYNTTKEKVLEESDGTSVAVRVALGETQLVEETKKFLEDNGVKLDAFNQAPTNRSKTIILVKNLPPNTKVYEIREIFAKHGELGRVIMPPSGVTALVEYLEPSEARKAVTKLAYTKFKHLPLYLEFAPDNSLTPSNRKPSKNNNTDTDIPNKTSDESTTTEMKNETVKDEDEDEPEQDTTLFVKHINSTTTDDMLNEYFSKCGPLQYATVAKKKDPQNPGEKLSMGYAFVRYKCKADADKALKDLQNTEFDGRTLELKRSERTLTTDVKTTRKTSKTGKQSSSIIMVKNIPFQATTKEIKELFNAFGEIKSTRLPKKYGEDGRHRGFGFVEYHTKEQAGRAFEALSKSTHLYGRRLNLEWAALEEDVEDNRKRTAKHFHQGEASTKRSKKAVLDPESVGLSAE
ncbi:hypothetical protein HCN44_000255 [Aphidius gifuensis]|uniref:RRM domain-containing protein n=1 Tax=Aphidius gifuensis TaxID=684658 RepID=A0A834XNM1_APHGI|nr:probable RNA-binding protein 19 [Aphidius gifuensis]KAF7990450.1 hypothetical protein HCN44_000255 [Aphidius gifuensis]